MRKVLKQRSDSGATVALVMFLSFILLLPIGLYSFEIARSNFARTQLQSALDAATLAAASSIAHGSETGAAAQTKARDVARTFLRKQFVLSGSLVNVTQSDSVRTDSPLAGDVNFNLTIDPNDGLHTEAVYGLRPAFGSTGLRTGLTTQPIRCTAGAGYTGLTGDICVVLDISDSLAYQSTSLIVRRTYMKKTDQVVYKPIRAAFRHPALGRLGAKNAIPDPNTYKIDAAPKLKEALAGLTYEERIAALVEAKRGNLESADLFASSKADKGILKGKIIPSAGFKEDYQRLALENEKGLAYEKNAIRILIDRIKDTPGGHLSLVTFAPRASGLDDADFKDSFATFQGHGYPHVNLSKSNDNQQAVLDAIGPAMTHYGTDIKGGLRKGRELLTSDQHRPDQQRTIVLLTDGLPTTGDPGREAEKCGREGIRIFSVGYYATEDMGNMDRPYPAGYVKRGKKILERIRDKCGNGSLAKVAPNVPTLNDVMRQLGHGTLALTAN